MREIYDNVHLALLVVAAIIIVTVAILESGGTGLAPAACRWSGGTWDQVAHRNRHAVMRCRYRITGKMPFGEVP